MGFRKDINGLRAIAVLAVILFHFKVTGFDGGFSGVDIFFVISGYLMTRIIFTRIANHQFSVIDFYLHRAKRIIPALAFLCITLSIFGFCFFLTADLREVTQNIRKVILFISNYTFYEHAGYFDTPSKENWLLHTWSLSVEWQFYLIYPLILIGLSRLFSLQKIRFIIIIMAIISLIFSIAYTPINPSFSFYSLPTRSWEMLAGGIVFLFPLSLSSIFKRLIEWGGLGLILLALVLFDDSFLWPGYLALIPVIGAMFIIWSNQNSIITANPPFQWIGKISYSVYLWHWPVAVLLLTSGLLTNPIYKVAGIIVSFIFGIFSYLFIEKKLKLTHSKIVEVIKYIGIILTTILFAAITGSLAKHHPELRSKFLQDLNYITENKYTPFSKKCLLTNNTPPSSECISNKGELNMIVLGDSHASVLFSTIDEANKKGSSALWAMGNCPFIQGAKFAKPIYQGCNEFVPARLKLLETSYSNIPVLISNQLTSYFNESKGTMYFTTKNKSFEQNFRSSYINTVCKIAKTHPVYIIKPIPRYPYDVPKKMASNHLFSFSTLPLTISLSKYQNENSVILDVMKEASNVCGVKLLDPTAYLCQNNTCHANIKNQPFYFDSHHLTKLGAEQLFPLFEDIFINKQI
ncbi:acyltransferase [Entomomonas moraniae]|uniref:Acyltransferase n=1 Tax=Entomomonas moraniae TaxID=2213226 RepID=A0A3S9XDK4_9GAMM|nr:acyltransferase family protein [Entomomonas moraniae]AZS50481.1 acyltransferase [Entomomonas moraniae]